MEQYGDLLKAIPGINAELEKKTGQGFDDPDEANLPAAKASPSKKDRKFKSKANIETTSEEEDD